MQYCSAYHSFVIFVCTIRKLLEASAHMDALFKRKLAINELTLNEDCAQIKASLNGILSAYKMTLPNVL